MNTTADHAPKRPTVLIFMGVTGCGKTTVAALFAQKAGAMFYEGDDYHPPENLARLRDGIALTDADRKPWLERLREVILHSLATNQLTVLTCSALKASYRDVLSAGDPRVKFVHLTGPAPLIAARLAERSGHFMAPALLASQFAILEPPLDALVFSCEKSPSEIVGEMLQYFGIAAPA